MAQYQNGKSVFPYPGKRGEARARTFVRVVWVPGCPGQ